MSAIETMLTKVLKSKLFPLVPRLAVVVIFTTIIAGLLFGSADKYSLFNLLVWLTWWPMICLLFLFAGRLWCGICPFSTVSSWIQRTTGLQLSVPEFLKQHGVWLLLIAFFFLSWMEEISNVMDSPRKTAVVLLSIMSGAIIFGLFFKGHTWCRYVCPLGGLSLVYGRTSLFKIRNNEAACAECTTKDCVVPDEQYAGCPMHLTPFAMDSVVNCKLCGSCVKRCANDSLHIEFEAPSKDLSAQSPVTPVAVWMIVLLAGLVCFMNSLKSARLPLDTWLHHGLYPVAMKTAAMAVALGITYVLFKVALKLAMEQASVESRPNILFLGALPMIPLVLFTHLSNLVSRLWADGSRLTAPIADMTGLAWLSMDFMWGAPVTQYAATILILAGLLITLGVSRWALMREAGLQSRKIGIIFGLFYTVFAAWNLYVTWPSSAVIDSTLTMAPKLPELAGWTVLWPFVGINMALLILVLIVARTVKSAGDAEILNDFSATRSWVVRGAIGSKQTEILEWLLEQAVLARWRIPPVVSLANASQEIMTFLQRTLPTDSPVTVKAILRKNKGVLTISHEGRPLTLPDYKAMPNLDSDDDLSLEGIELRLAAAQVEQMSYQARLNELHCSFTLRQTC